MGYSCTSASDVLSAAEGTATLSLRSDDIVHVRWQPHAVITHEHAQSAVDVSRSLVPSGNLRLLIEMTSVSVSCEARQVLNGVQGIAAAALLGVGPVDKVTSAFAYNAIYPACFFTSREEALEWLEGYSING